MKRSNSAVANPIRWQGRWRDQAEGSPLVYFRARYYDPKDGRFTSSDPIGAWGDSGQFGNGYGAFGNNGPSSTDPFGLDQQVTLKDGRVYTGRVVRPTEDGFDLITLRSGTVHIARDDRRHSMWVPDQGAAEVAEPETSVLETIRDVLLWLPLELLSTPFDMLNMDAFAGAWVQHDLSCKTDAQIKAKLNELAQSEKAENEVRALNEKGWWDAPGRQAYGNYIQEVTGGRISAAEAMAANPSGGLVGPGLESLNIDPRGVIPLRIRLPRHQLSEVG